MTKNELESQIKILELENEVLLLKLAAKPGAIPQPKVMPCEKQHYQPQPCTRPHSDYFPLPLYPDLPKPIWYKFPTTGDPPPPTTQFYCNS